MPARDHPRSMGEASPVERRLTTILIADVFDYGRLMAVDEERTVRTLRGHRDLFDQLLRVYRGRVFNTAGDAILAEFGSAVEAVRCATEIQTALRARNEQLPDAQRMWFRIGINLGDVILQGGDMLGDGVNVAARIQSIAEPGAVCISGSVYDQIQNQLTLPIRSLGEQAFKNIAQPIRTFSIRVDDRAPRPLGLRWRTARKGSLAAALAVGLIATGATGLWLYRDYGVRAAQDAQGVQASKRVAQLQAKGEQDRAAVAALQKESALLAQLRSAKEALAQVEASTRKAAPDQVTAEAMQRQAKHTDDLNSAKQAVPRAERRVQDGEDRDKSVSVAPTAATQAATAADPPAASPAAPNASAGSPSRAPDAKAEAQFDNGAPPPAPPGAGPSVDTTPGTGPERFDGVYAGQMCSPHVDNSLRCWEVILSVQQGKLSAAWPSPWSTQFARASGTISRDGTVALSLAGFRASDGRPNPATMTGRWAGNTITASGSWTYGGPVNAVWKWAPDTPLPVDNAQPAVTAGATKDDPDLRPGRGRHRR